MSCFTSETSVPEIEHARHAPSFGHHTKALAGGGRNFEQIGRASCRERV